MFLLGSSHCKLPSCKLSQLICHWSKLSRKIIVGVLSPGSVHSMRHPPKDSTGLCLVSCVLCSEHAWYPTWWSEAGGLTVHVAEPLLHFMANIYLTVFILSSVPCPQLQR